ncbi:hypothetical protein L3Y34_002242 [Caenorhabditis briggsae]|uniref:Uncharacterized protein n=2 Tax=Caenorhabditis briggsae TaxID=6238 RepID=A0AAE9IRV0_CAEBR|nr:hypothetical protein L3Y34_002242 [Caenorhabditis briggsae]
MNNYEQIGPLAMPYNEFDIQIADITETKLEEIGLAEEVGHLSPGTFDNPAFPVHGILHGLNLRLMVPLTFQRFRKPDSPILNVWCLVSTASPFTCLTVKTMEALLGAGNVVDGMFCSFSIQDQNSRIECEVSNGNFENVNILGMDAMCQLKLNLNINWDRNSFELIRN